MSNEDSDDDLLTNLLATANDFEVQNNEYSKDLQLVAKKQKLNSVDSEFINSISSTFNNTEMKSIQKSVFSFNDHVDSSDEEDNKYFEKQRYSEYGKEIKHLLKEKEPESLTFNPKKSLGNNSVLLSDNFKTLKHKDGKVDKQTSTIYYNTFKTDVHSDPIFGLRIVKPLISSAELIERMQGRKAVSVSSVKLHLSNQAIGKLNEDWVIAGVILNKSDNRTSQKGNQYCIWKITDLSTDMKTVSVFLFKNAYKRFWKVSIGTIIGILNPSVLESRDDKDLATLSVDIPQKVLIIGTSKDLGKCKSIKKNGEPCTVPVNLHTCEYCIYHVKQEYGKYSRRSELQTSNSFKSFGNTESLKKKTNVLQHSQTLPFLAIPAKRNEVLYKKDCERLALLKGHNSQTNENKNQFNEQKFKVKTTTIELSTCQMKKDLERLNKLRELNTNESTFVSLRKDIKNKRLNLNFTAPQLGVGFKSGDLIDFSKPISKSLTDNAKLNAIDWVKRNGQFKKANPNKICQNKEIMILKGIKRKREESEMVDQETPENKKTVKNKFQKLLEITSTHTDLVERREDEDTEQYFIKFEAKDQMEKKMLATYKINCKAIYCRNCKYVALSSSDLCKKLNHCTQIIDAVKRFFKCGDCDNRTISLDRIPTETCKRCLSYKWIKSSMIDEKRTKLNIAKLCVRGGEETFIGSNVTDANLNLLVPETD